MAVDIARNQGALLLGGYFAAGLSGFVFVQTIIYYKLYPQDPVRTKVLVAVVWAIDMAHSGLVFASIWDYLITSFLDTSRIDHISTTLTLTIILTAILTFIVHCFFAHRIWLLSKRNWLLPVPALILATLRLVSAASTVGEMLRLGSFSEFKAEFRWLFSLGLALSSVVDIFVTLSLFVLLQSSRSRSLRSEWITFLPFFPSSLDAIIDSLILYTFETGAVTTAATIVSLICWLAMSGNLIFMGLHFVIGKLYANSLLAALNTRQELRDTHRSSQELPQINFEHSLRRVRETFRSPFVTTQNSDKVISFQHVQVNVEKSITYE